MFTICDVTNIHVVPIKNVQNFLDILKLAIANF